MRRRISGGPYSPEDLERSRIKPPHDINEMTPEDAFQEGVLAAALHVITEGRRG